MTYIINDNGVQRQMDTKEIEIYEQACTEIIADIQKAQAEAETKAQAKAAVLAKLGLTADEVSALLS